jgi:hypothetical protein
MGLWRSKLAPQPQVQTESEMPLEESRVFIEAVPRWRYSSVFWATPVFLYNRTLPSDGHSYIPVHPVEPFRAQQYVIKM